MSYNIHIIERLETQVAQLKETVSLQALEITDLTQQYRENLKELQEERQRRCGTCEFWESDSPDGARCFNPASECNWDLVGGTYTADHGCPAWRAKDGAK